MSRFSLKEKSLIAKVLIEKFDVSVWEKMVWLADVMNSHIGATELLRKTSGNLISAHVLCDKCTNRYALLSALRTFMSLPKYTSQFRDCIQQRIDHL